MAAGVITTMTLVSGMLAGCTTIGGEDLPPVVIGADLALSGDDAALGTTYHDAMRLIVEQINEQDRLGGRELRLEVRDNRSDRATSETNLAALAADSSVTAIVSGACYECLLSSVEVINDQGVPTIALAAADGVSEPVDERHFVFKLAPNSSDTAAVLAAELDRRGATTIGLVTVDDDYGADGQREMTSAAERAGIEVVVTESLAGDEGIAAAASRVAGYQPEPEFGQLPPEPGPDAVVLWGYADLAGEMAVSLREQGYDGDLFLDAAAADDLFLSGASGDALAGATMVFTETLVIDEVIATSPAKAARKTWFRDYTAQYGTYAAFASFAADAVQLVVNAVNRFDSTDRETVRDAIEAAQIDGLTGPIRMTPDSHSGLMPQALTVLVASGDRWRLAS